MKSNLVNYDENVLLAKVKINHPQIQILREMVYYRNINHFKNIFFQ